MELKWLGQNIFGMFTVFENTARKRKGKKESHLPFKKVNFEVWLLKFTI
jgi:hypothetical protein